MVDRTSAEIASLISHHPDVDLKSVHTFLVNSVAPDSAGKESSAGSHGAQGPSTELDNVYVSAGIAVGDVTHLGTFDRTVDTRLITVAINARSPGVPGTDHPRGRQVNIPLREQIGWVRAVLGNWADYAYRVVTDMGQFRVRPAFFVVLVDVEGAPRLAPSDFDWLAVSSGGRRAYPEKLFPADQALLEYLRKNGDLVPAELVSHPQAQPPAVWAQKFVSSLTESFADHLGRMGEDRWFTIDEIRLTGESSVIVQYTWHLVEGDRRFGFDIDLEGLRAHHQERFDDPRAQTAAYRIGGTPFDQPVFRSPTVVDGVTWVRMGYPDHD
ncbi:hypothetical protein COO55_01540 [Rhodococcus opacus]|nr:hypothetical protein COO55_01540 [Rhodococcus opacus]